MNYIKQMTDLIAIHDEPGSEASLNAMAILLSYPMANFTSQYFIRTRDYDKGLQFVNKCQYIISTNKTSISCENLEKWELYLLTLKLALLDYSNDWEAYVELYNKEPTLSSHPAIAKRHGIICRKLARKRAGKPIEHLKRHQKERLTLSEQERRYAEMLALFIRMAK